MKYIKWLWDRSGTSRLAVAANMALGCISIGLNLWFIWVSKRLVDIATGACGSGSVVVYGLALVCAMLLRVAVNAVRTSVENNSLYKMALILRQNLYGRLLRAQWQGIEKMHSGDAVNRLFSDIDTVSGTVCQDIPSAVSTLIQLAAAFTFLCTMDWRLALALLLVTPLFALFSKIFFRRMRRLTREIREAESQVQSRIQESIQHKTVIQSMELEDEMEARLRALQDNEYASVRKRTGFNVFSRSSISTAFGAGYSVALLWGVAGISCGTMTFGMLTAFLQLVGQIQGPSMTLARQMSGLVYAAASMDRLMELENVELEETGTSMLPSPAGIRIRNLSFKYAGADRPVFDGFTYDFRPGSRTAVVGPTGVGKTTLIRLVLSLLRPDGGSVELYSGELCLDAAPSARANIIYVPQGNTLFSGTVRDNLLMGDPRADEEMMWKALDTAAAGFVRDLPDGLDTRCGELGAGLSEGQAQRIAIARGLLRPGSIMLLDELSSSLDPETEARMLRNLTAANQGKTMIFITHRDTVEQYCDAVLRL